MMATEPLVRLTREQVKNRRGRNIAVALALVGFVVLVFVGSVAKMQSTGEIPVLNHPIGN